MRSFQLVKQQLNFVLVNLKGTIFNKKIVSQKVGSFEK